MSTPAQIRRERKTALRSVRAELRTLDSLLEKVERKINRTLKVKKRFPDNEDAIEILQNLRSMDSQLDKVISSANNFGKFVATI